MTRSRDFAKGVVRSEFDYTATAAQTTFSGNDDDSESLAYTAGQIDVYLNGSHLNVTDDYVATNGTSVVLQSGAAAGDILHVDDDIILGEVASVTANNIVLKFDGSTSTNHAVVAGNQSYTVPADIAAWRIQNGAGAAGDAAEDEIIYNIFPLRIFLHFEK